MYYKRNSTTAEEKYVYNKNGVFEVFNWERDAEKKSKIYWKEYILLMKVCLHANRQIAMEAYEGLPTCQ